MADPAHIEGRVVDWNHDGRPSKVLCAKPGDPGRIILIIERLDEEDEAKRFQLWDVDADNLALVN